MPRHVEPFTGGLVTSENASELQPGQSSRTDNAVFIPNSKYICAMEGHTQLANVNASAVEGLRDIKFDNGNHYLVAHAGTEYRYAVASAAAPTFSLLASAITSGTHLERLHFSNQFLLFNGAHANQVVYLSATATGTAPSVRGHGLSPVTAAPGLASASGGTWPLGSATGYFEFWTTEVAEYTVDGVTYEVESNYELAGDDFEEGMEADPATILVSSSTTQVSIERPDVRNSSVATGWRVYRSPAKERATDKSFPIGFLASPTIPTGTNNWTFGASTTATAAVGNVKSAGTWTNPTFASASNNQYATTTTSGSVVYQNLGFTGLTNPISGIEVSVEAKRSLSTGGSLLISLSPDDGTTWSQEKSVFVTTTEATRTLGGNGDTWGLSWTDLTLADGAFLVRMRAGSLSSGTTSVDYVKVTVYYAGAADASENEGTPFPAITVSVGGVDQSVGSHGLPANASTGTMHDGYMITNDLAHPSFVRWSLPGGYDYQPGPYFLDVETEENDRVTLIQSVNNVVVIASLGSKYRMNYVPTEALSDYNPRKAFERYDSEQGVVNETAACLITVGSRQALLTCGFDGVFLTDGFTSVDWTTNFNWAGLRDSLTDLTTDITGLVNDSSKWEAALHYIKSSVPYSLRFNYHPRHMTNGLPKISGPCIESTGSGGTDFDVKSAWTAKLDTGVAKRWLGTSAGNVRVSPRGVSDSFDAMAVATRRMWLAGEGGEWQSGDTYLYSETGGAASTLAVDSQFTDKASVTYSSHTFPNYALAKVDARHALEGAVFTVTNAATVAHAPKLSKLIIDGVDFGPEDSGA